jgi:hypothetical protein
VFNKAKADNLKYSTFEVVIHNRLELSYGQIIHILDKLSL